MSLYLKAVSCRQHIDKWCFTFFFILSVSPLVGASLIAQLEKNLPSMQETLVWLLGQEDPWRRDRLSTPVFLGFPGGSNSKESACNAGDLGLIPGLGRSPGGGHGNPLQCSCLENPHGQKSLQGRLQSMGSQRVGHNWATQHSTSL